MTRRPKLRRTTEENDMYTSTTDIPNLAFLPDGSYDLSTPEHKLAACEAALYHIANTVPLAYHERGPEFVRDQMMRQAQTIVEQLRLRRKPADGVMDLDCFGEPVTP